MDEHLEEEILPPPESYDYESSGPSETDEPIEMVEPRGKKRGNREPEKEPAKITDSRHGAFFVVEKTIEPDGHVVWVLAPTVESERQKVFKVRIANDPSVDKSTIMRALDGQLQDVVSSLSMIRREGDEHWDVWSASSPPPEKDRTIERDFTDERGLKRRMKAFTWTEELDEMVDKHHTYGAIADASAYMDRLSSEPSLPADFHDRFAKLYREEVSRLISPHSQVDPAVIDAVVRDNRSKHESMLDVLEGREEVGGQVQQRYYSVENLFETHLAEREGKPADQVLKSPDKIPGILQSLANYCRQRALSDHIVDACTQPRSVNGVMLSPQEARETDLVTEGKLFATNPLMDSQKWGIESRAMSRNASAQLIRGCIHSLGGQAVVPKHNDVAPDQTKVDSRGTTVPRTLTGQALVVAQARIKAEGLDLENSKAANQRRVELMLQASRTQSEVAGDLVLEGKGGIVWQQVANNALHPPFTLTRPLISLEASHKIGSAMEIVAEAMSGSFKHLEGATDSISFLR